MSKNDLTVQHWLRRRLHQVADRVRSEVPTASCSVSEREQDMSAHICASSLATPAADALDLCFEIIPTSTGAVIVTGDLVVGGTGTVLAELEPVELDGNRAEALPPELAAFIDAQEQEVVRLLTVGDQRSDRS